MATIDNEITFDCDFECGNATGFRNTGDAEYSFEIRPDTNARDRQWFAFRVHGAEGQRLTFHLQDTDKTNIPIHWDNACPVASPDGGHSWSHITGDTSHDGKVFTFTHKIGSNSEIIAFHVPYGFERNREMIAKWAAHDCVSQEVIGQSSEGRDIDMLRVAEGTITKQRPAFWITCRQHAGESSASWTFEGFVEFLLSDEDEALRLRRSAVVSLIPMMNPDGVIAGNYRVNIHGVNLNRVWGRSEMEKSCEIVHVEEAIDRWVREGNRYDFFADFHSDSEALSHYAFHADHTTFPQKYPNPDQYHAESIRFLHMVEKHSPEFNINEGATDSEAGTGISRSQQMERYGVLALIFEAGYSRVIFKDREGYLLTPDHHKRVGRAIGLALVEYFAL